MKRPTHKQLHRHLTWIFLVVLLAGLALILLGNVRSAAHAYSNPFPVSQER